ncbi:MAG: MarR family transcriptional regulator [Actinobacteria bacterium]|nr:MarR family transcriptional regulator [Actinomycetota bacterium]
MQDESAPNPTDQQDLEYAASRAFVRLNRAAVSVSARANVDLTEVGLTFSQFAVLEVLYSRGSLCQKDIAQRILAHSSGNMTLVVDHLEEQGLVERTPGETDRRQVVVRLTPKGELLIRDFRPRHVRRIADEMSALSVEELHLLGELCRRVGLKEAAPE